VKVAYFTAGTVGAGHLVRGLAIGRALGRAGFAGSYRMFGPPLAFPAAAGTAYEPVEIRADRSLLDPRLAQEAGFARRLADFAPDLLLVDLFWMPLRWVLPILPCEAWLLLRTCPPRWLVGPTAARFDPRQYARILAIEPMEYEVIHEVIDPVVIANPEECRPPQALREHLGIPPGQPLTVVLHAGEPGEAARLREEAGQDAAVLDLFQERALFPVAEWLGGADRIVSGAGYNAYWEARRLGYADKVTFVPFLRAIDDQERRLTFADYQPRQNGADVLAGWIVDRAERI
jgi:hypothetical protein